MKGGLASISFARLQSSKGAGQAERKNLPEVGYLYRLVVAKQVLGLQVAMQVVVLVHVGQSLQRLKHNVPDHLLGEELASLTHQLVHIEVEVLEDELKSILL